MLEKFLEYLKHEQKKNNNDDNKNTTNDHK